MNHQPVFQHIVQMPGNAHIVDRNGLGKGYGRNPGDDMPTAEAHTLGNVCGFDVFSIRIQNQVCACTAHHRPIFHDEFLQLFHILFNANVYGIRIHNLTGGFIQSLDPGFCGAIGIQIFKGNNISAGKQDTGITREAAGSAENQTVRIFQQLPIHHDDVVTQGVDAVVQRLRAVLIQLLGGEGNENRHAGGGQPPLNLNLVEAQGQAADHAFLLLIVQCRNAAIIFLGDGIGLKHIVVQLPLGVGGVENQEGNKEHSLVPALQIL